MSPASPTVQSRILDRLEEAPGVPAYSFYDEPQGLAWMSRGELGGAAAGSAERWTAAGLEPGRVCLILMPSDATVVPILLGALLAGATPLLLAPPTFWRSNPDLHAFLAGVIQQTDAAVMVRPEPLAELASGLGRKLRVLSPQELSGTADLTTLGRVATPRDRLAALQMTSGTTDRPRICAWDHASVLATLDAMAKALRCGPETVFFNWTPLYHDLGLVNNFLFCLVHGIPLAQMSPVTFVGDPASWLRGLSATRATTTWSPNFGFSLVTRRARDEELEGVRLDRVSGFWNAAEKIHRQSMRDFHQRFATYGVSYRSLKASYGCAENVGGATFSGPDEALEIDLVDRDALFGEGAIVPSDGPEAVAIVGVGRPVEGVEIQILSETGGTLPERRVGEIALEGPSRMREYLGDPEATRAVLAGARLRTGDLGYLRDGQLFWTGRVRERITTRGQKLDPSAFEPILLGIEGLREGCFAAFGVDHAALGTQRVVIVSEVRWPLARALEEIVGEVRREIYRRLEIRVDDVVLVRPGTLGKTSSGKRRHQHFRLLYQSDGLDSLRLDGEGDDE